MELSNDKKWLIIQLTNLSSNEVCVPRQKGFALTVVGEAEGKQKWETLL